MDANIGNTTSLFAWEIVRFAKYTLQVWITLQLSQRESAEQIVNVLHGVEQAEQVYPAPSSVLIDTVGIEDLLTRGLYLMDTIDASNVRFWRDRSLLALEKPQGL